MCKLPDLDIVLALNLSGVGKLSDWIGAKSKKSQTPMGMSMDMNV